MGGELRPDSVEEALAEQIDNVVPSHGYRKSPVVGLGGSAGSIEALQTFFTTMPARTGLAFAVAIHLSPEHESTLSEVLQRATRMKVVRVDQPQRIRPDTVYVIPPGKALKAMGEHFETGELESGRPGRVAIDILFRSLADSHGAHAAAVVLSGADGDGAVGIKRIKERGGLAVVQDPDEALHPAMPKAAVDTGMVDWVLPVRDMPARLLSFFRLEKALSLPAEDLPGGRQPPAPQSDEDALRDVLAFLRTRTGRDFAHYKRATVLRRIGRRMQVNGIDNLPAYLTCLRTRTGECQALLQDLLITVTNFFRDPECFAALESHIPSLFEGKGPNDTVRVWSVACATGEEAYSLAMLLTEHARRLDAPPHIQVFATDLDEQAIQFARDGIYPPAIAADVSAERLKRFFIREHRGYRVRREVRERVLFAVHDVLKDSPFSRLDLVSCRNLLIYLKREAQARVLDTLHFSLVPQGKLFLGSSESVDDTTPLFVVLDKKNRIYVQRPTTRSGLPVPSGPATLKLALEQQHAPEPPVLPLRAVAEQAVAPALRTPHIQDGGRTVSWGEVHLRLLEHLAPPTVLLNRDYDILHLSPNAGRYLRWGGGEPSRNLLRSVDPDLRIELRAALYQAAQTRQPVLLPPTQVDLGDVRLQLSVRVTPSDEMGEELFVVAFQPQPAAGSGGNEPAGLPTDADPLARHLDREIERLKLHLRDTVEQYEASTEELKASNEELQAMNEELRSATEELETSREELQSINEELITVNQELKSKVDELSHANSDIQNLMNATPFATVFLDRDLRIARYTPSAVQLFNLIPTDLGRPLSDLSSQLEYPELASDAQRVLQQLAPVEREVGQSGGGWFLARLVPYRTLDDRIAGVVLSLIDITERKHAEEMRMWLSAVVTASSDAIVSFSLDHTILSWNSGAERIFGFSADEAIGQPLSILACDGQVSEQQRLVAAVARGESIEGLEVRRRRKDGRDVFVALTIAPIKDSTGQVMAGTALARDITGARQATEALRRSNEQLRTLVENAVDYAIFAMDLQRRIVSWNMGAQRLLGYGQDEAIGMSGDVIFREADQAAGVPQRVADLALSTGRAAEERRYLRRDGSEFRGSGILVPLRNDRGEVEGFMTILRDLAAGLPNPSA